MTILDKIRQASMEARKSRNADATALLTTVLSDCVMVGKNNNRDTTDAEVIAIVKKFIKNIDETISTLGNENSMSIKLFSEKKILVQFVPLQLSEDDIRRELIIIKDTMSVTGPKAMGLILKEMKTKFEGQYDGGTASRIAKVLVNE